MSKGASRPREKTLDRERCRMLKGERQALIVRHSGRRHWRRDGDPGARESSPAPIAAGIPRVIVFCRTNALAMGTLIAL
jgi:hypothetical protein